MAFLRAREIEDELKRRGQDKGTVWCLQVLAEQQIALQKDVRTLAEQLDTMANIINQLVSVGENMRDTVDRLNSAALYEDGMPKNTQDLS